MKAVVIGCGKMGGIVLSGICNEPAFKEVYAIEPNEQLIEDIKRKHPNVRTDNDWHKDADIIFVCVKPNLVNDVVFDAKRNLQQPQKATIVSIAAGMTIEALHKYQAENVIRVMPNTPCQIGEGMSAIINRSSHIEHFNLTKKLFESMGKVLVVNDESKMDTITALSGSGPGLVLLLLEAMADGGVLGGMSKTDSLLLAAQTMFGTAKMVLETGQHPAILRDEVCTPGGCTIAGLAELENSGVRGALIRAIKTTSIASRDSSRNLGN